MAKKKLSFREKMARARENDKSRESSYGYLNVPGNVSILKIEDTNKVHFDFLPYIVSDEAHPDRDEDFVASPGDLWWRRPFRIHRNIGPSSQVVVCPSSFGKPCPICEYRTKLFKEGADKELTDPLKLSYRYLYVVRPVGHKKFEDNVHIWDISYSLFQKLLDQETDEKEEYLSFPSLEEGFTLAIRFTEESLGKNKFYEASRIDFEERDPIDEAILEDVPDLDKVLKVLSYKELETLFLDYEDPDEDEEEEEEEKPARSIRRKKKVVKEEEIEEEDEEDLEEDEEEEEEKPKRRKKTKPAPKPEPEEEEEDEEEEEEEEKPKRKTRTKPVSKNKCPHGYKFGVDTDDYDECDTCEIWDSCIEKKEE